MCFFYAIYGAGGEIYQQVGCFLNKGIYNITLRKKMKISNALILFGTFVLMTSAVSAYERPWASVDICNWGNVNLPLGSNYTGCVGLNWNTYWPIGDSNNHSYVNATCTFDGSNYQGYDLYVTVDNDVKCWLNGNLVMNEKHEGCAPADPKNGYRVTLNQTAGSNTLLCTGDDYGAMSHFDAYVAGTGPISVPEFPSAAAAFAVVLCSGAFVWIGKK
jgi:hypothetical protein